MQQIVSITDARNNLSQLVAEVSSKQQTVVIVRDSQPEAMLVPYAKAIRDEEIKQKLWALEWEKFLKEGKKIGHKFLKKKGLKRSQLTEEQLYDLIDQI